MGAEISFTANDAAQVIISRHADTQPISGSPGHTIIKFK